MIEEVLSLSENNQNNSFAKLYCLSKYAFELGEVKQKNFIQDIEKSKQEFPKQLFESKFPTLIKINLINDSN